MLFLRIEIAGQDDEAVRRLLEDFVASFESTARW